MRFKHEPVEEMDEPAAIDGVARQADWMPRHNAIRVALLDALYHGAPDLPTRRLGTHLLLEPLDNRNILRITEDALDLVDLRRNGQSPAFLPLEGFAAVREVFHANCGRVWRQSRPHVPNWLAVLNRDSRDIFTAASKAQEAVEYLCNLAKSASG